MDDDDQKSDRRGAPRDKRRAGRPDPRTPGGQKKKPAGSFGERSRGNALEGRAAEGERIAKRLARAGIASRRDAEELIAAGRV
jgi:23S rRNA pseudouridine2605 synthase